MGSVVVVGVLVVEVVVVVEVEVLGSCSLLNMEQMVCFYFIWIKQQCPYLQPSMNIMSSSAISPSVVFLYLVTFSLASNNIEYLVPIS